MSDLEKRKALARRKGVCARTIARLEQEGLPVVKLGPRLRLYPTREVDAWFAARTEKRGDNDAS